MKKLSTGDDSTLGNYMKLCKIVGFMKAYTYFEEKAMLEPKGQDAEVLADESQMMGLIATLERGK